MKKLNLILSLLLALGYVLNAQTKKQVEVLLKQGDSITSSSQNIADYIALNFASDEDRLKAIYLWITHNIQYDIENTYNFQYANQSISQTLSTRKGVCQNYAELFCDISNKAGVEAHVILGYTKQNNLVNYNPHAWCVALINSNWFMFDPTWGAGIIQESAFLQQVNMDYFKMTPQIAINTHMPFDPLWQLLDYPISNQVFCAKEKQEPNSKVFFNYTDSLNLIREQGHIENLIAKRNRIDKNGINSYLVYTVVQQLDEKIEDFYFKQVKTKYDSASYHYKLAIYKLNRFIDYRNKQFKPDKGDQYLVHMLDSVSFSLNTSLQYLESIRNSAKANQTSIDYLYKSIDAGMITFEEQQDFLDSFLKTSKVYRKSLFYDDM